MIKLLNRVASFLAICATYGLSHANTPLAEELGITPDSLVIAGLSLGQASSLLAELESQTSIRMQLSDQKALADAAVQVLSEISSVVTLNPESSQDLQFQVATVQLQSAQAQITILQAALFDEITAGLATQQVARLNAWRDSAGRKVPKQFRVLAQTDEQWSAVEQALRAESRALRRNESLTADHANLLIALRTHPDVIEAQSNLALHTVAMSGLFQNQ